MYRLVPAHIYISICVAAWGLIASAQSLANGFPMMFVLRAALGISEAAFGPGCPFYLSFFYKRAELGKRVGIFISCAPLATSFASSLAWAITKAAEGGPFAPWRLLFLVEGFPSVIVAVFAWNMIPDGPRTATFLNQRERKIAESRLAESKRAKAEARTQRAYGLNWRDVGRTLIDPQCYLTAVWRSSNV